MLYFGPDKLYIHQNNYTLSEHVRHRSMHYTECYWDDPYSDLCRYNIKRYIQEIRCVICISGYTNMVGQDTLYVTLRDHTRRRRVSSFKIKKTVKKLRGLHAQQLDAWITLYSVHR